MDNKLKQERSELNALINKGYEFDIKDVEFKTVKRFWVWKKRIAVPVTRRFKIEEPTLGTLDRMSAEWIELKIDEKQLSSSDGVNKAKELTHKHALRCAKIVALAVLGSDYLIPKYAGGVVRYAEDTKRLQEMTDLFARTLKPSTLFQMCAIINTMSNLGDFMNSIRLMSAERTTSPIRVEENNED